MYGGIILTNANCNTETQKCNQCATKYYKSIKLHSFAPSYLSELPHLNLHLSINLSVTILVLIFDPYPVSVCSFFCS